MGTRDQVLARAVEAFAEQLEARLRLGDAPVDADELAADAAGFVLRHLEEAGTSLIATRIGPVHVIDDLCRWLPGRRGGSLTNEAVRRRAVERRLVAFLTDDRQWAFPAWQFRAVAGRLVVLDDVVALWRRLPDDGWLTDVDLAVWMASELRSLGDTPAGRATSHGVDDPALVGAVERLLARAA